MPDYIKSETSKAQEKAQNPTGLCFTLCTMPGALRLRRSALLSMILFISHGSHEYDFELLPWFQCSSSRGSIAMSMSELMPLTPSSSRPSTSCSNPEPRDAVDPVQSSLNAFDIDNIKGELIKALEMEHEALMEDIRCLQVF